MQQFSWITATASWAPLAVLAAALAFTVLALAYTFPPLIGRVVDDANIIPQAESTRITARLASLEAPGARGQGS